MQDLRIQQIGYRLSHGRIESTKRNVVGAVFTCLHRQIPAALAGHPKSQIRANDPPCFGCGHVVLTDMYAVATHGSDQIGPIVQKKGNAPGLRNRPQLIDAPPPYHVLHIF